MNQPPQGKSLSDRRWVNAGGGISEGALADLCRRLEISAVLGRVLAARQLSDAETARGFLHPGEEQLHPPQLMLGMSEGVARIWAALEKFENILIFGDYDVDGTAAATILYVYLQRLGARVHYFIPNRISDGYGLNPGNVPKFKAWGVDLVITVDHGSTAVEGARALAAQGIDLVVTDHHRFGRHKPECAAIINPQQPGCPYPFKELSAAGVAYKVTAALDDWLERENFWDRHGIRRTPPSYFFDLVALATVADMSPLVGENRVMVKLGLDAINSNPRPGIGGLIRECKVRGAVSPTSISFKLAPKINALGRIGDPRLGVQLFTSRSFSESRKLARLLVATNRARKTIEQQVFDDALEQVENFRDDPASVLVGGKWHPGVIGPIATRVAIHTRKPSVVLTLWSVPDATGSARSGEGVDVLDALAACEPLLHRFGGHPKAAGLSLHPDNLDAFTREFHLAVWERGGQAARRENLALKIDAWVTPAMLCPATLEELGRLSPFGHGNPEPVLGIRKMKLGRAAVYEHNHLRVNLRGPEGGEVEGMAWNHADLPVTDGQEYDVAFVPRFTGGQGAFPSQIKVLDLFPCA